MNFFQDKKIQDLRSKENQIDLLKNLLQDETADDRILEWGGRLALENNHWEIAENIFSCLLERRKKVSDLFCLGESLLNQLRCKEAEECFLEALNQISEPCPVLFKINKYLGQIYVLNKNYPMAEEYYNKAYTLDPHSLSLQFHRALLKLKEKKYDEAENLFQKAVKTSPASSRSWLGLAISRYFLEEKEIALACLNRCLDLDSKNSKAHYLKKKWSPSYLLTSLEEHFKFSV